MGSFRQFSVLLWKNYKLQIRHPWVTAISLAIPLCLMSLLIVLRQIAHIDHKIIETPFFSYDINTLPPEEYESYEKISLYYSPESEFLGTVMKRTSEHLNVSVVGFKNEDEMVASYIKSASKVVAGVVFDPNLKSGIQSKGKISFVIRPEAIPQQSWNLTHDTTILPVPELTDKSLYGSYYPKLGFLAIQHSVAKALIETIHPNWNKTFDDVFDLRMHRNPYPPYYFDSFYKIPEYLFAIFICLSFLLPSAFIAKLVVHERNTNLKKTLLVMGVSNWQNWLSWFLMSFVFLCIISLIISVMLLLRFQGIAILNNSGFGMVFLWLMLYSANVTMFTFFISVFFRKEKSAVASACMLFIVTFVPYIHSRGLFHKIPYHLRLPLCFLPNTLFAYSHRVLIRLELLGKGLNWDYIDYADQIQSRMSMRTVFFLLIIDFLIYLLLMWYMEVIFSDQFQRKHPWYFPVTTAYWAGSRPDSSEAYELRPVYSDLFEKYPSRVRPMVCLKNVSKLYGSKSIVKGINLNAYKGQITVILGHHCSGKSTIASMIYGGIMPSFGSIFIKGFDANKTSDKRQISPLLGICPAYDVYVDELTVKENLYFFCNVKGFGVGISAQIDRVSEILDLEIKKHNQASVLTANIKRRLTIGIALIGESEVVVLDEPTSHMNPYNRRMVWEALNQEKRFRSIILTTSVIREADAVADRIFFVDDGKLKCSGSPTYLKKLYGTGYQLAIKHSGSNNVGLKNIVSAKIPNSEVMHETDDEVIFSLPHDDRNLYSDLLKHLEEKDLKIESMIIDETPLSVFYERMTDEKFLMKKKNECEISNFPPDQSSSSYSFVKRRNEGCALFRQHMNALFKKRFLFSSRNYILTAAQLFVLPLILLFSNFINDVSFVPAEDKIVKELTLQPFNGSNIVYGIDPSSNESINLGDTYASIFDGKDEFLYMVDLENTNYGSFLLRVADNHPINYRRKYIIGATFEKDFNKSRIVAYYNSDAYHSAAISLLYLHNAILAYLNKTKDFAFHVGNQPLPYKDEDLKLLSARLDLGLSFFWCQDLMIGMSVLMSSFVVILVLEKHTKSKSQQTLSGINAFVYWLSSFLYDFAMYLISCGLLLFIFSIFETECLSGLNQLGVLTLLLVLHGISSLLYIYCCTFFCNSSAAATITIFFYYFFALCCLGLVYVLEDFALYHVSAPLDLAFSSLMPSYCVGRGIYNIYRNCVANFVCNNDRVLLMCQYGNFTTEAAASCCLDSCKKCTLWAPSHLFLSTAGIAYQLIFLIIHPFIFCFTLILFELGICRKSRRKSITVSMPDFQGNISKEVEEEANRIMTSSISDLACKNNILIVREASKYMSSEFSISKFTLGVKKNECFGVLGMEQAGKSTVLEMIAGNIKLTTGTVYINGYSYAEDPLKIQDKVGFCFGTGALLKQFTVAETLNLYAHIRGIPQREIQNFVDSLINLLSLQPNVWVKHLNDIDKQKLCVAIAILGTPPLILLDEPTTQMDPTACNLTRQAIRRAINTGCTVFLTSARMKECQEMCKRIGIIANGKFNYIGDLNKLKQQHEGGITIILRVKKAKTRQSRSRYTRQDINFSGFMDDLKTYVEQNIPQAVLKIELPYYLDYFILDAKLKWSEIFALMEKLKNHNMIEDYSVYKTALENSFAYLATMQKKEDKRIPQFLKERKKSRF